MPKLIDLENTDVGDLFVSVWDKNKAGAPKVLDSQRINRNDKFPLSVEVGGDGYFSIRWYAERTEDPDKQKQEDVRDDGSSPVDVSTYFG